MIIPRLYAIVDAEVCCSHCITVAEMARQLARAGVQLVQYRDKKGTPETILQNAALIRDTFGSNATLIMNDRVDLALLAGFDGVHLGQQDMAPADAHRILGNDAVIGISTHTEVQVITAEWSSVNYTAIGPVFATGTKADAAPVVGIEGVRMARENTIHNLVAIGGITRANAASVLTAGADSIAVISAFFSPHEMVEQVARDFLRILR